MYRYIITFLTLLVISTASAIEYSGVVTDSITGEPLSYTSIRVKGTQRGTITDDDGKFSIDAEPKEILLIDFLGYNSKTITLNSTKKVHQIKLSAESKMLDEIVVRGQKERYSKKDNPAVELMKKVIDNKANNSIENADYYQRSNYEKLSLGLTDVVIKENNKLGLDDVVKKSDTSVVSGKPILLVSLKEKAMTQYYRKSPLAKKQIVNGKFDRGVDDQLFADEWLNSYMDIVFQDINIYEPNISIAMKNFVSPLSSIATDFYKFYIKDTVVIDDVKCYNVFFTPHNAANFGFMGFLSITDSTYAIKKVEIRIHKDNNINYLNGLTIVQTYEEGENGNMVLSGDVLTTEMLLFEKLNGIYVERQRKFSNYKFNNPNDSILRSIEGNELVLKQAYKQDSTYWSSVRPDSLSTNEQQIGGMLDKLNKNPIIKAGLFVAELLIKGYIRTSKESYFDFGPVYSFISGSTLEGVRLKIAGETTAKLSPNFFMGGYVAYGFLDNKVKYGAEMTYSFIDKKNHPREFPMNGIKLSHTNDIKTLGEAPVGTISDNWAYAIKRMSITNAIYYRNIDLRYDYEMRNGFSFAIGAKYEHQIAAGTIFFNQMTVGNNGNLNFNTFDRLHNNEVYLNLRYAPKEKIVQGRAFRFNTKNPHPVFELTHKSSIPNFLGAEYGYQATEFKYLQRFFLSAFGRIDVTAKMGKIWTGDVAYPYLLTPNSNTSFTIMDDSFSQINPLEFVADQYMSLDVNLTTNGLLFNLIPGIKKLKLREVAGFKCYWGSLSEKNNPEYNENVLLFPQYTQPIKGSEPYMEFNVGIDNIFSFLRIDYVRRINYLNTGNPHVWANGVRITLNFQF